MKKWLFILAVLPMLFFSCRKDVDDITINGTDYQPPVVIVTGDLSGLVVLEDNTPVPNAIVRVGNVGTTTDENGLFQFRNTELNSRGTYVTVEKPGYFPGSTRLYPQNNSSNFTKFELLRKTVVGTIDGTAGGAVDVQGAKITLPANGVVDAQNNTVTGDIHVAAQWLDPTANNLNDIMPGGLFGLNTEGREEMMASFGMLAVELQDAAGNELQVAPGHKAELSFPVPTELLGNAPAEIPLWSFDEELGVWVEEGSATLQDGHYVGKVSHFSFWNVDVPAGVSLIYITGTVLTSDGNAAANRSLRIIAPSNTYTYAYGITDESGHFSGYLPAGDLLTFEIYDDCGVLSSFDVGPYNADADVGTFTINNTNTNSINGQIVNCNGAPIESSIVAVNAGDFNYMLTTDANGDFSTAFLNCNTITELSVQAFDLANLLQSDELTFTVSATVDAGTLTICENTIDEYITTEAGGYNNFYPLPTLGVDDYQHTVDSVNFTTFSTLSGIGLANGDTLNYDNIFNLYLGDLTVGTYTGDDVVVYFSLWDGFNYSGYLNCLIPCNDITLNITSNGGSGGYLEGDFNGTMGGWGPNQNPITENVSGAFRVLIP